MAIFEIKSNLPIETQLEINRIESLAVTARTAQETALLVALAPYLTNEILQLDTDGLILEARGITLPTSYTGFAKGATFIKYDNATKSVYENTGSTTEATWNLMGEADGSDIADGSISNAKLANPLTLAGVSLFVDTAPVNAVAASKLLTIGTNPIESATVTIGAVPYKFRVAIGAGAASSKVLTSDNTELTDGDTVTIGSTVYRFKDTMTQAYDVKRDGTTADTTLGNLIKAINATGTEGVEYFAGTLIHPTVSAGTLSAHAFTASAKTFGFAGNSIAIAENSSHLSWAGGATALSGGIDPESANDVLIGGTTEISIDNLVLAITAGAGEGTNYGTGTVVNPLVTAVKASASTMTATNLIKGVIGNATAIAETLANGSWASGDLFLTGGINGTVGVKNEIRLDDTNLYICTAVNTIADANWKKLVLQSL